MKILLMCGAGASSGFMAQAMRKAAKDQGLEDIDVIARSEAEMANNLNMCSWIIASIGFLCGGILLFIGDKLFNHFDNNFLKKRDHWIRPSDPFLSLILKSFAFIMTLF